ncbi:MAG TPA: SDR family oxidoreductase [Acidimicrobiales bacterium]|nr:SDR family oxidoreductase [Acidimicrobiales bacterium]
MSDSLVAMVTGARVGIGQATAVAFGQAGLRVALTSRSDPGSAVREVEAAGGQAMGVALDLLDRPSIDAAVEKVISEWGGIDILVNNALCDQPGSQALIDEMDFAAFERMIVGEVVNTAYLTRQVLHGQADRKVTVVNIGSAAADFVPRVPIGQGGYSYSYAANKSALHRLGGFLQLEYGERMRAFTVNPGVVRTERLIERLGDLPGSVAPSVPADVVRWLALDPESDALVGQYLHAQKVAKEKGWL